MKLVDRETLLREREERRRVSMAAWPACWPLEGEPPGLWASPCEGLALGFGGGIAVFRYDA